MSEFDIIYADPPWRYKVNYLRCSPNRHYPTMTTEEICNIKIPASKDSVLFLWATNALLKDALRVMERWGFEYKTNLVWVKNKFGIGFWFRGQHELLLVGVKGSVIQRRSNSSLGKEKKDGRRGVWSLVSYPVIVRK